MTGILDRTRLAGSYMVTWLRAWWWVVLPILGVVVAATIGVWLSFQIANSSATPLLEQAAQITDPEKRIAAIKDISQYQIDNQIKIWTGLVQAVGVVVLG